MCDVIEKRSSSYRQLIDTIKPTCEQVRDWSTKFDHLMNDVNGRKLFQIFLQQEHSEENLLFWVQVDELKVLTEPSAFTAKVNEIYFSFLKPMAEKEVNVAGGARRKIEEDICRGTEVPRDVFDAAQMQLYNLMHRQSYPRFLGSDIFNCVVQSTYGGAPPGNPMQGT